MARWAIRSAEDRAGTVKPFVALRTCGSTRLHDLVAAMDRIIETGGIDGAPVDYLDGVVFSADESYLCLGVRPRPRARQRLHRPADLLPLHPAPTAREARPAHHSRLPVAVGHRLVLVLRAFGAQTPDPRLWPRRYRRSSFYWKLIAYDQRFNIADRIEKRNGAAPRARRAGHRGADRAMRRVPRLVPGQRADRADLAVPAAAARRRRLAAVPDRPHHTYVNVGFWSSVPVGPTEGTRTS
jgi:hypothetical protein